MHVHVLYRSTSGHYDIVRWSHPQSISIRSLDSRDPARQETKKHKSDRHSIHIYSFKESAVGKNSDIKTVSESSEVDQ